MPYLSIRRFAEGFFQQVGKHCVRYLRLRKGLQLSDERMVTLGGRFLVPLGTFRVIGVFSSIDDTSPGFTTRCP